MFVFISCYLAPEYSTWGRDSDSFFTNLLNIIYTYGTENVIINGDFNARVENLQEAVFELDQLPKRVVLDQHINQHGRNIIDFLNESVFCILNGRLDIEHNVFICKTARGMSVVDYVLVPQNFFTWCKSFQVISCNDFVDDLLDMIEDRSKLPDHNILLFSFETESVVINTLNKESPLGTFLL